MPTNSSEPPGAGSRPRDPGPAARYKRKALLGKGGMASVYKSFDRLLRRNVAVKVLQRDLVDKTSCLDRFVEEAQVTAQLQHPGITPVYDMGYLDDGQPYFTMKALAGLTLEEILEESALPASEWTLHRKLQAFLKVCETIAYGHSRNVIHRDLKPSNVMVGEYGEVIVMDWGISKIVGRETAKNAAPLKDDDDTRSPKVVTVRQLKDSETAVGETVGTPRYMSPEQARGDVRKIDAKSDIYSLGVILFRILANRFPFDDADYNTLAYIKREPPSPRQVDPAVPAELARICSRCLAPDRKRRFDSVPALIKEIHVYMDRGASFRRVRFEAGTRIITKGAAADEAYFILRGRAEVHDASGAGRVVYATLSAGDVFGEMAIFTGEKRNAHVSAVTDLEALVFDRRTIQEELNKVQPWMGDMINNLADKLAKLNEKYAAITSKDKA